MDSRLSFYKPQQLVIDRQSTKKKREENNNKTTTTEYSTSLIPRSQDLGQTVT